MAGTSKSGAISTQGGFTLIKLIASLGAHLSTPQPHLYLDCILSVSTGAVCSPASLVPGLSAPQPQLYLVYLLTVCVFPVYLYLDCMPLTPPVTSLSVPGLSAPRPHPDSICSPALPVHGQSAANLTTWSCCIPTAFSQVSPVPVRCPVTLCCV